MRSLIRSTAVNTLSLFILTLILPGVKVTGGYINFLIGGFFLSVMFMILKPALNLISLPLNLVTLGTFSFFVNVLIFYLATVFVSSITISEFVFQGFSFSGFIIPKISFSIFFAYVAAAFLQVSLVSLLNWLIKR
mgnify:CR=1 FL=1